MTSAGGFDASATIYASATPTGVAWIWDECHKEGWAIAMDGLPTRAAAFEHGSLAKKSRSKLSVFQAGRRWVGELFARDCKDFGFLRDYFFARWPKTDGC